MRYGDIRGAERYSREKVWKSPRRQALQTARACRTNGCSRSPGSDGGDDEQELPLFLEAEGEALEQEDGAKEGIGSSEARSLPWPVDWANRRP